MKLLNLLLLMWALTACSLFNTKERPQSQIMVKDVPYQARAGNVDNLRKRVIVLPFVDEKTDRSQTVMRSAREAVVRSLSRSGQFVIVKNEELPHDLGKFITEQREYDLEKLAPIAASLGVAAIVEGKIMEIKARRVGDQVGIIRKVQARVEATIRIRVIASKNGRLILEDVRKGEIESSTTRVAEYSFSDRYLEEDPKLVNLSVTRAFQGSILGIVRSVEKISWEGRVALVSGERIFINAGRVSGIQMGDILKITEEGDEIFDPDTGRFIGRAPGRMKGTIEVVSYFGTDGAIGLIHSGSGFQENDRVELY